MKKKINRTDRATALRMAAWAHAHREELTGLTMDGIREAIGKAFQPCPSDGAIREVLDATGITPKRTERKLELRKDRARVLASIVNDLRLVLESLTEQPALSPERQTLLAQLMRGHSHESEPPTDNPPG